jgi:hypothetical protein
MSTTVTILCGQCQKSCEGSEDRVSYWTTRACVSCATKILGMSTDEYRALMDLGGPR